MSGLGLVRSLQRQEELDYNNREHQTTHGSEETLQAIGVARLYYIMRNLCLLGCFCFPSQLSSQISMPLFWLLSQYLYLHVYAVLLMLGHRLIVSESHYVTMTCLFVNTD